MQLSKSLNRTGKRPRYRERNAKSRPGGAISVLSERERERESQAVSPGPSFLHLGEPVVRSYSRGRENKILFLSCARFLNKRKENSPLRSQAHAEEVPRRDIGTVSLAPRQRARPTRLARRAPHRLHQQQKVGRSLEREETKHEALAKRPPLSRASEREREREREGRTCVCFSLSERKRNARTHGRIHRTRERARKGSLCIGS